MIDFRFAQNCRKRCCLNALWMTEKHWWHSIHLTTRKDIERSFWLQKQPGRCNKCVTFGTRNGEVQSKCCSNKCWELWCENQKWNTSEKANRIITTGLPRAGSLSPCILKARDLRAKVVYRLPHGVRREARAKKPIWGLPRAGLLSLCIYLEGTVRPKVVYRLPHGIYCCS